MNDKIILISKDALRASALSCYGGKIWDTPNIDALSQKGTVFKRHYTAAASSAMSYTSMFTGEYCHNLDRKEFVHVGEYSGDTLFRKFENLGYACHVMWGKSWEKNVIPYTRIYGPSTHFHNLEIEQKIGGMQSAEKLGDDVCQRTLKIITDEVSGIKDQKFFLWVHFPHVLYGRNSYDGDIDLFDQFVGEMRKRFGDDSIYITSDHGHMNLNKGVPVYGFHVYEEAIHIPLITPIIENEKSIDYPTSHTQLMEIIFDHSVSKKEFIVVDTQYYLQENRRIAIIKDHFKYIFSKKGKLEELYDLEFDPGENINLLLKYVFDKGRGRNYLVEEIYHYKRWDILENVYQDFRKELTEIWKTGNFWEELFYKLKFKRKYTLNLIRNKRYKDIANGRFSSNPYIFPYNR
jgi:hypothetical protein